MLTFLDRDKDDRSIVLVGFDFSETAERALTVARNLTAPMGNPEIHLVHVISYTSGPFTPEGTGDLPPQTAEQIERAKTELSQLASTIADDRVRLTIHIRTGAPSREIVQLASDLAADLIVIGTHGRSGVKWLPFGSVAERVVRTSPCPVLTVRPKDLPLSVTIDPPCQACVAVQRTTRGATLWCDRHSQHHPHAHTHYQYPPSFGMGAQTFR